MNGDDTHTIPRTPVPPTRCFPVALTILAGLTLSVCGLILARTWERRQIEGQFQRDADRCAFAVLGRIRTNLLTLELPRSFFHGSEDVTRQEFHTFAQPFVSRLEEARVWAWVPRIENASRAACEAAARKDGFADFAIREFDASGAIVPAKPREDYFPVLYVEPLAGNEPLLGLDVTSAPERRAAARQACDEGVAVAFSAFPLVQEVSQRLGIHVYLPVFKGGSIPASVAERRQRLLGFFVGAFFADQTLRAALAQFQPDGLCTRILDVTGPEEPKLLGSYPPEEGEDAGSGGLCQITDFEENSRRGQIQVTAPSSYVAGQRTWLPWTVLPVGLSLSLLLAANHLARIRRSFHVENLVARRTAQLREREQEIRTILETVQVGIAVVDAQTNRIVDVNPVAAAMIGGDKERIVGQSCRSTLCAGNPGPCRVTDPGQAVCSHDCNLRTADGRSVPILKTAAAVTLSGKRCILESFVDITPRKVAEEERRKRTLELESANRALENAIQEVKAANSAKSQFLANISHELRTPLHGILSFAAFGVKRTHTASPERLLEYFELIHQSGTTLLHLVNDLLDLAKLESGRMDFEFATVELAAVIAQIAGEMGTMAADRAVRIDFVRRAADSRTTADATRVAQVIRNVLSNAIKFSPSGGTVEIELSERDAALAVCVRDRGVGIPEDELEAVFDKFIQSSKTRTGSGGTGLGLAICRQIVGAHGGRIWAANRAGGGAALTFELPRNSCDVHPIVEQGPGAAACVLQESPA